MLDRLRRLLITLVLLAVAASAAASTAHARQLRHSFGDRSHATAGVMIGSTLGARPASGEPDGGATKDPPLITQAQIVNSELDGGGTYETVSDWFQRIGLFWMARSLGVR